VSADAGAAGTGPGSGQPDGAGPGAAGGASAAAAAGPAVAEAPEEWLWLSPRSLVVRPVTDLIRLIPVLIGLLVFGSSHGSGGYWGLGVAVLAIGASVVRYCTTRYRITSERVYLRRGLLNTKILSVPRDRVRSVDLSAHVVYRLLGLRKVEVGTGRNDRREGESLHLDALLLADAERLRTTLLSALPHAASPAGLAAPDEAGGTGGYAAPGGPAGPDDPAGERGAPDVVAPARPAAERELARLQPGWIRFAPLTLTGTSLANNFNVDLNDPSDGKTSLTKSGTLATVTTPPASRANEGLSAMSPRTFFAFALSAQRRIARQSDRVLPQVVTLYRYSSSIARIASRCASDWLPITRAVLMEIAFMTGAPSRARSLPRDRSCTSRR